MWCKACAQRLLHTRTNDRVLCATAAGPRPLSPVPCPLSYPYLLPSFPIPYPLSAILHPPIPYHLFSILYLLSPIPYRLSSVLAAASPLIYILATAVTPARRRPAQAIL